MQAKYEYFPKGTDIGRPEIVINLKRPQVDQMDKWTPEQKLTASKVLDAAEAGFSAYMDELRSIIGYTVMAYNPEEGVHDINDKCQENMCIVAHQSKRGERKHELDINMLNWNGMFLDGTPLPSEKRVLIAGLYDVENKRSTAT